MSFAAPLSVWAIALAVALIGALAWLSYGSALAGLSWRRGATLAGLRVLSLLLLLIFLMRPVRISVAPDPSAAVVPVLVDVSRSMALRDMDGTSRLDAARALVRDRILPSLEGHFHYEVLGFGEDLSPVDLEAVTADDHLSDISQALGRVRQRFAGRTVAGVVLVSDGAETHGAQDAPVAAPLFPVYAVGVGAPVVRADREVASVTATSATLADSLVELTAAVVARGVEGSFDVRVLQDGQLAHTRAVTPNPDGTPVRVTFRVAPKAEAPTSYTVEVPADASEVTPDNNRRSVIVPSAGRPRRLLVVEGGPGFEHTFIKRALELDRQLRVDSVTLKGEDLRGAPTFLIQAEPARAPGLTAGFPSSKAALFEYDGVILSSVKATQFTGEQLQWLAQFVGDRGGGLLVMGADALGPDGLGATPVNEAMPIDLTERTGTSSAEGPVLANRVVLTAEGATHPMMQLGSSADESRRLWAEKIPALGGSVPLGTVRPAAAVLALTAGGSGVVRPLVAVQPYGRGRSAVFSGEGSWRWRMQMPSQDHSYETFWRQVARWLANESPDPVAVRVPPADAGQPARIVVEVRTPEHEPVTDAHVTVAVSDPGGATLQLPAPLVEAGSGTYAASWSPATDGVHRFQASAQWGENGVESASSVALVGGQGAELADPRQHAAVLRRIAEETGGKVVEPGELSELGGWLSDRAPRREVLSRTELWHHPLSWLLLACCLSAEWVLRRRWGLR